MPRFKIIGIWGSEEEDFLKVLVIYWHGGHLDHVIKTIFAKLGSLFPTRLRIKFGFDWPCFREKMFEDNGHIHVISPDPLWLTFVSKL